MGLAGSVVFVFRSLDWSLFEQFMYMVSWVSKMFGRIVYDGEGFGFCFGIPSLDLYPVVGLAVISG
jgi:hypothetical protein